MLRRNFNLDKKLISRIFVKKINECHVHRYKFLILYTRVLIAGLFNNENNSRTHFWHFQFKKKNLELYFCDQPENDTFYIYMSSQMNSHVVNRCYLVWCSSKNIEMKQWKSYSCIATCFTIFHSFAFFSHVNWNFMLMMSLDGN